MTVVTTVLARGGVFARDRTAGIVLDVVDKVRRDEAPSRVEGDISLFDILKEEDEGGVMTVVLLRLFTSELVADVRCWSACAG